MNIKLNDKIVIIRAYGKINDNDNDNVRFEYGQVVMLDSVYLENKDELDGLSMRIDGLGIDDEYEVQFEIESKSLKEAISMNLEAEVDHQLTLDILDGIEDNTSLNGDEVGRFSKNILSEIFKAQFNNSGEFRLANNYYVEGVELSKGSIVTFKENYPEEIVV